MSWFAAAQITAICQLGPDYQSTFLPSESDPAFDQAAAAASVVVEGKEALAPVLLMSYNAQATLCSYGPSEWEWWGFPGSKL